MSQNDNKVAENNVAKSKIAVVIPCYKVKNHILKVLASIGDEINQIYIVDDKCPENSGDFVKNNTSDTRIKILYNEFNLGVGGAVKAGYKQALADGCDVVIKLDGDGQMNPADIPDLIAPIINNHADYTKGNRFSTIEDVKDMPTVRLLGNSALSIITKLSSGYWHLFDPTNGYTAIHASALKMLNLDKISNRYFFESDILFRLNTINAVVVDVPMRCIYADEVSGLNVLKSIPEFLGKNAKNFAKRIFYNYFLRNFNIASLQLVFGAILLLFGLVYGGLNWFEAAQTNIPASTGNVVLPALAIILGFQLLLSFLNYDIENKQNYPLQLKLSKRKFFPQNTN
jgi:dolichol-phosphate mannosyltransferase